MARLFIEGFEHGSATTLLFNNSSGASVSGSPPSGFTGSYYGTFTSYAQLNLSAETEVYISAKIRFIDYSLNIPLFQFYDASATPTGALVMVYSSPNTFYLRILRGAQSGGTVLETDDTIMSATTVRLLEVHYKPLDTGGDFEVKIDGVTVIDYSGDTTAGLQEISQIKFGYHNYGNPTGLWWDDIVVDNADWIGNTRIQKLQISGAGATAAVWDASTGSPYACVDEIPYSDTDYIYTNTSGECDTYTCADLSGNISEIKCLVVQARMSYEGSPSPTKQKIAIKSGETEYYGNDISPTLSFTNFNKIWEKNPSDGITAWTTAAINSLEIGVKAV